MIKTPLVNDRFSKMSFHSKKVTSGLLCYVSQPVIDKKTLVNDVVD